MVELSYKPVIEDMTWSYSRIATFRDCPYKFFLKYIKGYKGKEMFYASYGSFMHKLIELYYKGELSREEMLMKFLFGFQKEVKGDRPAENIVENYIKAGTEYIKTFTPFPLNGIAIEKEFLFEINGYPMRGYVDYIGERDGEVYIIDHKSRNLKQRSGRITPTKKDEELDEMLTQLYIYASAVKQHYGEYPKYLCFNCFKNGEFIKTEFDENAHKDAMQWVTDNVDKIMELSEFPPYIEFFPCRYLCDVSDHCCYAMNNRQRGRWRDDES